MSYFGAIRLYSALEVAVFAALLVAAAREDHGLANVLGWTHGIGWIALCVAVYVGCRRRVFPWPLLAATVSPFGPVGSTIGIEWLARRRTTTRTG